MGDDLIAAHGDIEKLMPYLHLPVQSGSDAVLEAMNRQHTADDYRSLIERIRAARPDIALSSDFIVGFPGESDADFEATLQLVRDIGYRHRLLLQIQPSGPARPPPPRASRLPEDVKTARLDALAEAAAGAAGSGQFRRFLDRQDLGRCCSKSPAAMHGQVVGRTPYLQPVHVEADAALIGSIRRGARSTRCTANSLQGPPRLSARAKSMTRKAQAEQVTSEFPDNRLLAALGGPASEAFRPHRAEARSCASHMRGNLVAIGGHRRDAPARARSCARCMPGWKPAKASPWPKWMPKSASPMPASTAAAAPSKTPSVLHVARHPAAFARRRPPISI